MRAMSSRLKRQNFHGTRERGQVALWDLLTVLSGASAVGGGIAAAKAAKEMGGIYFLTAGAIGLLVGVGCVWIIRTPGWKLFELLEARAKLESGSSLRMEFAAGAIYLLAFAWLFISIFLGYQITKLFVNCCLR